MKHVLFDLKQCLICSSLNDEEYVKETLIEASKIAKLEVLKVDTHKFEPHGVTGYALLAESHMSIHTYQRMVSLDAIYSHVNQAQITNL